MLLGIWIWRLASTPQGKVYLDNLRLSTPAVGDLYKKLYLSRITDNLNTMLSSGVPIVRAIDITADVVGSLVYKNIMTPAGHIASTFIYEFTGSDLVNGSGQLIISAQAAMANRGFMAGIAAATAVVAVATVIIVTSIAS